MTCSEFREELIEAARGRETPAHAQTCAECGAFLARQRKLNAAMTVLRFEADRLAAAHCPLVKRSAPARPRFAVAALALAAAACIAAIVVWRTPHTSVAATPEIKPSAVLLDKTTAAVSLHDFRPALPHKKHGKHSSPAHRKASVEEEFVPLPYTVPLAPGERAEVLRVEAPVADLMAAGLPIVTRDPSLRASADVIVGQDGRARAFRVVSVSEVQQDISRTKEQQ